MLNEEPPIVASEMAGEPLPDDPEELKKRVQELARALARAQNRVAALESQVTALRTSGAPTESERRELRLLAEQFERQAMLLERDEHVARELQRNLRPVLDEELEGLDVALATKHGTRVGGDFYDIISLSDKFVAFIIADVSGYGLPAAVIMATGRLAFRTYTATELNPIRVMQNVNKALLRSTLAGHYMTAFLAILDTELLTLQYVNASHCTPFILREGEVIPLDTEGLFVGMFEEPQYEQKGMQLEQNDQLFLYTDGLLRGFDARDRSAMQDCLRDYLNRNSGLGLHGLVDQLGDLMAEPEDDVALMGVQLMKEKAQCKTIAIPSIPSQLSHVENAVLPVLTNKGYGERSLFAVKLAMEEAVINAIKHGNQLDDTKKVTVEFALEEDCARISVQDEGEGFDPDDVPDPTAAENITATCGRGLALINAYMDDVYFNDTGNRITMVKKAPWATDDGA